MQDRATISAESTEWQSAHYKEPYYSIRTAKLPRKLSELGVLSVQCDAYILDACCGRGEALNALRKFGFHNLQGIDATPQPSSDTRPFKLHHGDVQHMPYPDGTFDLIINLHALHHMGGPDRVAQFLRECWRVLKPGGKLAIIDFPGSPQIHLLFWLLRKRLFTFTASLRNFAEIVDEEWSYLGPYLRSWPAVKRVLEGPQFRTVRKRQRLFLYYWTMARPPSNRNVDT